MSIIKILDSKTANQIAAGEVVERPSSVVKELCENSLDAGANIITVKITNGGIKKIQIIDNGKGMSFDDCLMSIKAHATSKIISIEDLNQIDTMGFRGEALASIASVSRLQIQSREDNDEQGTFLYAEAGKIIEHKNSACQRGTCITISDLFFNTPARYKFLKKDSTEANKINKVITELALARPEVSFRLYSQNEEILHTPGNNDLLSTIYSLFGNQVGEKMFPIISDANDTCQCSGYFANPDFSRKSRALQYIFVNNRSITSAFITRAVEDAYREFLVKGLFPIFVLKINIPSAYVDVNVHPQKSEVRFWNDNSIYKSVYQQIKNSLLSRLNDLHNHNQYINSIEAKEESQISLNKNDNSNNKNDTRVNPSAKSSIDNKNHINSTLNFNEGSSFFNENTAEYKEDYHSPISYFPEFKLDSISKTIFSDIETNENFNSITSDNNKVIIDNINTSEKKDQNNKIFKDDIFSLSSPFSFENLQDKIQINEASLFSTLNTTEPNNTHRDNYTLIDELEDATYIGQLFKTYLIFEKNEYVYLIDQHAAHEKVLYERFKNSFLDNKDNIASQSLLLPTKIELNKVSIDLINENKEYLNRLGFSFSSDDECVYIKALPSNTFINEKVATDLFLSMADEKFYETLIDENKKIDLIVATMACKSAIKAHDDLHQYEVKQLVNDMRKLKNPYHCPHGRPSIIKRNKYYIEKLFQRIVN